MSQPGTPSSKRRRADRALDLLRLAGLFKLARLANPRVLTVLNYHRVTDPAQPDFDTFLPNISASPGEFARQVDYLQRNFNVISCSQVIDCLRDGKELPPYSALVTFDDGYRDNYTHAFPILKSRQLPAIIFLTTNHIGSCKPFDWDLAAYCLFHSPMRSGSLPLLGQCSWESPTEYKRVSRAWVESLKRLPTDQKKVAVTQLASALKVSPPGNAFAGMTLDWDQVREMSRAGIEFGSHTAGHSILTCIPPVDAQLELSRSKEKIEAETGHEVLAFAYPNGSRQDYSPEVIRLVRQAGYAAAFTLVGGVNRCSALKAEALEIRRIMLSASDSFPRFTAKLAGGIYMPGKH